MTVRRGEAWGSTGPAPRDLVLARSNAELYDIINRARREGEPLPTVGLLGGDLCRAVGGTGDAERFAGEVAIMPVDLLQVDADGRECWAAAHVIARRRLGWLGPVTAVMNGQYAGRFDVAPRAHPGDGSADVVEVAPTLGTRARVQARRRLQLGTHLPHPGIQVRRVKTAEWEYPHPMRLEVDEQPLGSVRRLVVRVEPDALTVCV